MTATLRDTAGETGFFQFGADNVCYGRCSAGVSADLDRSTHFDVSREIGREPFLPDLPFSFGEVIDNLRMERYCCGARSEYGGLLSKASVREFYYSIREGLP